ncbi:IS5 family transposase [Caldichromatium japonicum]|uniref:IS5 family transposase n=1 Tax=Caldichromatium japonicum TaxID=2699430 RepID=A0A6G7VFL9_9GAMM|nr:IS5 family transposase [Caldichromatium japonicum]
MHVLIDSTGLKVFGEGEWKVGLHGASKRRTGRQIRLAMDEREKDIIGIEVTTADWGDSEMLPDLLAQAEGEVAQVSADGADDTHACHRAIAEGGAQAAIPPRKGAVAWSREHPRDAIVAHIATHGKDGWNKSSGYHRRSIAENMMFRLTLRLTQRGERLDRDPGADPAGDVRDLIDLGLIGQVVAMLDSGDLAFDGFCDAHVAFLRSAWREGGMLRPWQAQLKRRVKTFGPNRS